MAIFLTQVTAYRCERCGYEWLPRVQGQPPPTVCANLACKSPAWNKPRPPKRAKRRKARPRFPNIGRPRT